MTNSHGELIDDSTVRFVRLLPGPVERVWEYLVDGEKRGRWLCGGSTEQTEGGAVELIFHNSTLSPEPDDPPPPRYADMPEIITFGGRVTRCEPPRLLAHTWDFEDEHSEVTYELEAVDDRVRLTLTHRRLATDSAILSVSAGWHTHLDILEAVLEGRTPPAFWKTHTPLEEAYRERLEL